MSVIERFAKFAAKERSHGGPEPELAPIVWLTHDQTDVEKVWAAGVYCAHHCVPSAMAVWKSWRPEGFDEEYRRGCVHEWLAENWSALPVRNEMRSHRMVEKRAECLRDFALYTLSERWRSGDYDQVWEDSIKSVKYFGRYVAIKYMEFLRRMVRPDMTLQDLRIAAGAWSVREGLALLYPEHSAKLGDRADQRQDTIFLAEELGNVLRTTVAERYNLTLSHFEIQVLLCEFKQWTNGTFYPGVSHDEELEFAQRVETRFAIPEFWEARRALFPHDTLGELGGWTSRRKDQYGQVCEWVNEGMNE